MSENLNLNKYERKKLLICDGLSLAYLARDLMVHLGDPTRDVEVLPDPVPIALEIMPEEVSVNGIVRFFLKRMNKKWEGDKIFFDLDRDLLKVNSHPFWTSEHIGEVLDTLVTQQAL